MAIRSSCAMHDTPRTSARPRGTRTCVGLILHVRAGGKAVSGAAWVVLGLLSIYHRYVGFVTIPQNLKRNKASVS